jgi:hypothetical protein
VTWGRNKDVDFQLATADNTSEIAGRLPKAMLLARMF